MNILDAQLKARQVKKSYALVTLVKVEGTTPRSVGSKMIVFADGTFDGTIGGGVLEKRIITDAVQCLANKESTLRKYENRAEDGSSPCVGVITAFIDLVQGAPELVVCGAGHVGSCVIRLASQLGYRITVIDTRDLETLSESVRLADSFVHCHDFSEGVKSLETGPQAYYLVSTYGHTQDGEALAAALEKNAAYIGMIGSPLKIKTLFNKLREKGFNEAQLASVNAPVGLDIGGESPEEVAIAIVSELQMIRYGKTGCQLKNLGCCDR